MGIRRRSKPIFRRSRRIGSGAVARGEVGTRMLPIQVWLQGPVPLCQWPRDGMVLGLGTKAATVRALDLAPMRMARETIQATTMAV